MKKVLIVIGAAKSNMGSQMLLRGISKIVKEQGNTVVSASSYDVCQNETLDIPSIDQYVVRQEDWTRRFGLSKLLGALHTITHFIWPLKIRHKSLLSAAAKNDLVILVAADNYDYLKTKNSLDAMVEVISSFAAPPALLLYDFSIKKENITPFLVNSIAKVNAVTARDSLSFNNLLSITDKNKLFFVPDPAFLVPGEEVSLPGINFDRDYVGLNISSLVTGKQNSAGYQSVFAAYKKLIDTILSYKELNVLLIPHVMKGADVRPLKVLFNQYKDSGRVFLVDNEQLNGPQLKYIISKCRFFVGARTHATIAAYSSLVPTLVLGYSIKSLGIATDLFGSWENYVVNLNALDQNTNQLAAGFKWLYEHEEASRNKLKEMMPAYKEKVASVGEIISDLLNKKQ